MNERRLRQLNILTIITVFVGVCMMLFFGFVVSKGPSQKITSQTPKSLDDTWVLYRQGAAEETLIDLPMKLDANSGEIITIKHKIPDDAGEGFSICFYSEFQNVIVMVGDFRVYESGVLSGNKMMKNAVPGYNVVDIDASLGNEITLQFASSYRKYSGRFSGVYYGARGDIVSWLIWKNGISFVVSLMILVLTILLGVSLLFMSNGNQSKRKAAYGFGFILFAAAWIFSGNTLMQLLTGNRFATYMSSQIFLLLMPVMYGMYMRCFAFKRRYAKIFEIAIYVFAANFLTGIVFQLVGVCDFASYMVVTKGLILVGLLMMCFITYLAADAYADRSIYGTFLANVILTASCLLECLFRLFAFYKNYRDVILQTGLFVFAVLLTISIEKELIQEMNAERDAALSSVGHEKTQAVLMIDTATIYSAINVAISDLKTHDKQNSRLLYDTSLFMQHNMDAVYKHGLVPFSEELSYIRAYLGMQKRIHPGFDAVIEDKVIDFSVPYNTIKPLVEHATNAALTKPDGKIVVRSYERLDCYAIQIVDNGPGISPARKFEAQSSFSTIKKQLKSMTGSLIEIKTKPGKGTILTVKIPKKGFEMKE